MMVAGVCAAGIAGAAPVQQVSLRDDTGTLVQLAGPARRIVSLAPSNTEGLFAIGAGSFIVGATRFDDYPPAARDIPRVGGFADIDVERVLLLDPDLVLASGFQVGGVVARLRTLGLPVFVVEPRDAVEVLDRLEVLGRLVGRRDEAQRLAASLRDRLERVERGARGARRPRVFLMLSADLFTVARGSFAHDLIERAGGDNIAAAAAVPYPQLSDEAVIARDPEIIFIGGHQVSASLRELRARPGWGRVTAVREGHIVVLEDPDLASRPGPRLVEALETIAAAIHAVRPPTGRREAATTGPGASGLR